MTTWKTIEQAGQHLSRQDRPASNHDDLHSCSQAGLFWRRQSCRWTVISVSVLLISTVHRALSSHKAYNMFRRMALLSIFLSDRRCFYQGANQESGVLYGNHLIKVRSNNHWEFLHVPTKPKPNSNSCFHHHGCSSFSWCSLNQ